MCFAAMPVSIFSEQELVELEVLRDEEIDILVNQGMVLKQSDGTPSFVMPLSSHTLKRYWRSRQGSDILWSH